MYLTSAQARRLAHISAPHEFIELQLLDDYGLLAIVHNGAMPEGIAHLEVIEREPTGRVSFDMGTRKPVPS